MQTVIKSVDVEWMGTGAKKYGKATVVHDAGKGEKKQFLVSFKNPEVFKKVQELVGQTVDVENVKEGDFWTWKSITVGSATNAISGSPASAATTRVTGSNYETKEERAARQVLIVRQSSLSAAVETLSVGAKAVDPDKVLELAQRYTDWVFTTNSNSEAAQPFADMKDDIPY